MEKTAVQRLARVLRGLVAAVFVLNILCLFLVPGIVAYVADGGPSMLARALLAEVEVWTGGGGRHFPMGWVFVSAWAAVWTRLDTALLTLFYWLCGLCTAVLLWQARKVLDTILAESPSKWPTPWL